MKPCPWCEGRKVVGRLVSRNQPPRLEVHDQPCGVCLGRGKVHAKTHRKLAAVLPKPEAIFTPEAVP